MAATIADITAGVGESYTREDAFGHKNVFAPSIGAVVRRPPVLTETADLKFVRLVRLCQIADCSEKSRLITFEDIVLLLEFGNVQRTNRFHRDGTRAAIGSMVGAVQELFRPSRAVAVSADVCAGRIQRQRAEVDARHAGAGDRAGSVSGLSAVHHACPAGRGPRVATAVGDRAGTSGVR
jgi:hypothetical protein